MTDTPTTFQEDLMAFRQLLGQREFWKRPLLDQSIALTKLGHSYVEKGNPETDLVHYEAVMLEFGMRSRLVMSHPHLIK